MTKQYFVTSDGLAAGLSNPEVLKTLQGILHGDAHPMTAKSFLRRGFIAEDKRDGPRADHNLLVLSGAVERIREVLLHGSPPPAAIATNGNGHSKRNVVYVPKAAPEPEFSPTVEKVRKALTDFLQPVSFNEIRSHKDLEHMNPGTLRWAIQVLRRAGMCESRQTAAA